MSEVGSSRSRLAGKRIGQAVVLGLLSAGAVGLTTGAPAVAVGTTAPVYNCYTQWWNTAWSQKYPSPGAKISGAYYSGVSCSLGFDQSVRKVRAQSSTTTYDGTECLSGASKGWISYDYN